MRCRCTWAWVWAWASVPATLAVLACQETTASAPPRASSSQPVDALVVSAPRAESTSGSSPQDGGCTLTVSVSQLRNDRGQVPIALFDSPEAFPEQDAAYRGIEVDIHDGRARADFGAVSCGRYAVAVLHDENQNGEMDYQLFGIPSEGFGFSNDAPVSFGPPSFQAASFDISDAETIQITARYF